jgi:hypothetical protein
MAIVRRRWKWAALLIIATRAAVSATSFMDHDRVWGIDLATPDDFHHLDLTSPSQLSSPPSNTRSTPWDSVTTVPSVSIQARKHRRGRVTFDLRGRPNSMPSGAPEPGTLNVTTTSDDGANSRQHEQISLSTDPASTIHLIRLVGFFSFKFGTAFMGTLRLLAPLYVLPHNKSFFLLSCSLLCTLHPFLVSSELFHVGH